VWRATGKRNNSNTAVMMGITKFKVHMILITIL
jgi:hypothetical protein